MKKDLLKLLDLSKEDIIKILNTADQLKYNQKHHIPHDYLRGKTLAMIFEKNSTRTRVSFETGMFQLGGTPCSCPARRARSAGASRCRTPPGCWTGTATAS